MIERDDLEGAQHVLVAHLHENRSHHSGIGCTVLRFIGARYERRSLLDARRYLVPLHSAGSEGPRCIHAQSLTRAKLGVAREVVDVPKLLDGETVTFGDRIKRVPLL